MDSSKLSEFALIARLTHALPQGPGVVMGVGDDCTILDLGGEQLLLATCDSQVEGVHFLLQGAQTRPELIGCKALAVNLSDIAAMGGEPRFVLISLILPPHLETAVIEQLYEGLRQEAVRYGTSIVGGNIAGSGVGHQLVIDITLLGTVERGHVITRAGAKTGDVLCMTGTVGDAAAGLHTLLYPQLAYPEEACQAVRARCLTPQARVREGRLLGQLGPEVVTAMLDISDGLSGDVQHLCEQSGVGIAIALAQLPVSPALLAMARCVARDPLDWALHGGEDYELLFTVAPEHVARVRQMIQVQTGTPVTVIGMVCAAEEGRYVTYADGRREPLIARSWDHLAADADT